MLFLAGADHGYCEKEKRTRQNNLQSATASLQVVIGLCKRKETAALISQSHRYKVHNNIVAVRWLFFFCYRAATFSLFFYLNRQTSLDKGTQRKTTENELPSLTQCTA